MRVFFFQRGIGLQARKDGIRMKKFLQLFQKEHDDTQTYVSLRQLTTLQTYGYFSEDLTPFIYESIRWR